MPKFTEELLPHAVRDAIKWELASRYDLVQPVLQQGFGETSSRDCGRLGGKLGGSMVRVMLRQAEQYLAQGGHLPPGD